MTHHYLQFSAVGKQAVSLVNHVQAYELLFTETSRFFVDDPEVLADVEEILTAKNEQGFDRIASVYLNANNTFSGIVEDYVSPQITKRYAFRISREQLEYRLVNPDAVADYSSFASSSMKAHKCTKGVPCDPICLRQTYSCLHQLTVGQKIVFDRAIRKANEARLKYEKAKGTDKEAASQVALDDAEARLIKKIRQVMLVGERKKSKLPEVEPTPKLTDVKKVEPAPKPKPKVEPLAVPAEPQPLKTLIKEIHTHIGYIDPQTVQKIATKSFPTSYNPDAVTAAQAAQILKLVAKGKGFDLANSALSGYLDKLENPSPPGVKKESESGSRSSKVKKVFVADDRDLWDAQQFDWGQKTKNLLSQKLGESSLKRLILENHGENYGQRLAAALVWAQEHGSKDHYKQAAKIAKSMKLEDVDTGVLTGWWNPKHFDYYISLAIAKGFNEKLQSLPAGTYLPYIELRNAKQDLYYTYPAPVPIDE